MVTKPCSRLMVTTGGLAGSTLSADPNATSLTVTTGTSGTTAAQVQTSLQAIPALTAAGNVTVTGSQGTRVLGDVTAGNVIVSGAALNIDPGGTLTSHVASPVQVNTVLNAATGTTDMGNNVIAGDSTRYSQGLTGQFYQLTSAPAAANFNTLAALNAAYTATAPVAPFVARTTANGNTSINFPFINDTTGTPPGAPFAVLGFNGINTFAGVLRGQVFVSGSSQFFLRSDDGSVMFLAGNNGQFINNNGDHGAATVNATTTLGGWQDVVIGYYENTGTAGLRLALGADDDDHSVTNDMLRTVDPSGSYGGIVNVASKARLLAGGTSTLGTINLNGTAAGASMTLSSTTPQSGTVSNINVNGTGLLTLGANNTVNVENLNVPDGASLEKDGGGTLRVSVGHTFGSGATVGVSGGKLLLNGIGTGSGSVLVRSGGTLGGSGSMAGSATVLGGGHMAPGASIGTLTLGFGPSFCTPVSP